MAIQNDPRLFTGGSVVLDSSPSVNMYNNLLLRKQAKDEAVNQYFHSLEKNLNTAGVRKQDLAGEQGGITDDINKWRQMWMENKDVIRKGGLPQQEYMSRFQDIMRKIQQSKDRAKTELEIGKAKFEGKYEPDDDDIKILGAMGKSIYDPTSYKQDGVSEYGIADLSANVPDFDANKQNQFWTAATKGYEAGKVYDNNAQRTDKTTGKVYVPFKEVFSPDQIKSIADKAGDMAMSDRSAKKYFQKLLDSPNRADWDKLNNAYQSVYGKNNFVETPKHVAQAEAIMRMGIAQKQGEEPITDQQQALARSLEKMRFNSNLVISRDAIRALRGDGGGSNMDGNELDTIDLSKYGNPQNGRMTIPANEIPKSVEAVLKAGGMDISGNPYVELTVNNGVIEALTPIDDLNEFGKTIYRTDMDNAQLKYNSEPQKGQQMKFGSKNASKRPAPKQSGMVTMVLPDGRKGQIPADQVDKFLKDNPKAKRQ